MSVWLGLSFPDPDVPEHNGPRRVLKRNRAAREPRVLGIDQRPAVQRDLKPRAVGGYLHAVPLAAGVDELGGLGNVDDGAGAVGLIGPRVEDVDLVAGRVRDGPGILTAQEHAAVGLGVDPELELEFEIGEAVLADEEARRRALVGTRRPAFDTPVGVADNVPAGEI